MTHVRELEAEVEQRRAELERTAASLGEKLDVKAHGARAVHRVQDSLTTGSGRPKPTVVLGAVAGVVGVAALVWWRRRR